jgi:hypothetical protein
MSTSPLSPLEVLKEAVRRVPAMRFVYGVVAVVAAFAGVCCSFFGLVLVYIFSVLVISGSRAIMISGEILVYTTVASFVVIIVIIFSVVLFSVPCALAEYSNYNLNACSIPLDQAKKQPAPAPLPATGEAQNEAESPPSGAAATPKPPAVGTTDTAEVTPSTLRLTTQNQPRQQMTSGSRLLGSFGWNRPDLVHRKELPGLRPASFRTPVRTIGLRSFAGSLVAKNGTLSSFEPLVANKPLVWQHSQLRTNSKVPIHSRIQAGQK